ncbi:PorT family protein [Flammeovirga sp. MY04]|uniref:outer membrane beta-barrel protein n=1 Tax=Flammeovirga sp. MY04 TaxID=1191459 RepID=UPI0008062494|nr:outer membrane beta-barrel protein [Flammeovirga sp. MY04]ANQ47901.1 PorT family protein [Flammeovirga sp. MY04]
MNYKKIGVVMFFATLFSISVFGQEEEKLEWGARASFNIGASVPMYFQNMPERFSFSTTFNPSIGGYVNIPIKGDRNHLHLELTYTHKGNSTEATVKNQYFKVSDAYLGYVTGDVKTNISLNYIELPIQFRTNLGKNDNGWNVLAGLYLAVMIEGTFDGILYQGGTIEDVAGTVSPIGRDTPYDYSHDLVNFDWGAQFGIQKQVNRFNFDAQIAWGFNGIFPRGYETVDPNLFNLYGKIGLTYQVW